MAKELQVGDEAPDFKAVAIGGEYGEGKPVALGDFKGSSVVLYFYPKDDTPGCTVQACGIRDAWGDLKGAAKLFGISADSAASHRKFIDKFHLPFPLLSDPDKEIVRAYGVWVEKSFMGKKHMGIERSTFVIGPDRRLVANHRKVKPENHVELLRQALALSS